MGFFWGVFVISFCKVGYLRLNNLYKFMNILNY